MKHWIQPLLIMLIGSLPLAAQLVIKPHIGVYLPRMGDVNTKILDDLDGFRNITLQPLPDAGEIGKDQMYGVQVEYHAGEEYFFSVNLAWFDQDAVSEYRSPLNNGERFEYRREVDMFDFMFNLHYFFNYNSWGRFNKYMGMGVGLMVLNARSLTFSSFGDPTGHFDTDAEFTGNTLSGLISVGGTMRLQPALFLWAEGGVQYGNFGQLDGSIKRIEDPAQRSIVSDSSFDMTGFYLRGGVGVNVPFLR